MPERLKADDFLTIYAEGKVKVNNLFALGLGIEVPSLCGLEKNRSF